MFKLFKKRTVKTIVGSELVHFFYSDGETKTYVINHRSREQRQKASYMI